MILISFNCYGSVPNNYDVISKTFINKNSGVIYFRKNFMF